jgi:hypothetical protein
MTLTELVANHVFSKLTTLKEGSTLEDVKKELAGLDSTLSGLSDTEKVKLFEETAPLKSYVDARINKTLDTKQAELKTEFDSERQKLTAQLEELRAKVPMDDLEALKKAWLEAPDKDKPARKRDYEFAKMQADLETLRHEKEESDKRATRAALKEVAQKELGDRKLPPFVNLDAYLGNDEAETVERIKQVSTQYDEFMKSLKAQNASTDTPPDGGAPDFDLAASMKAAGTF